MGLYPLQNIYKESHPNHHTYFLSFISSGGLEMTEPWFKSGMTLTLADIATLIDQMITDIAKRLICT